MSKAIIHFELEDMDVEAPIGSSLQKVVEACGADITFGCRTGTCGTCRIQIAKNPENISHMEREEKDFLESILAEPSERLGCQIQINGNCTINYVGL